MHKPQAQLIPFLCNHSYRFCAQIRAIWLPHCEIGNHFPISSCHMQSRVTRESIWENEIRIFASSLFVSWFGYGSYGSAVPLTHRYAKVNYWTLTPTLISFIDLVHCWMTKEQSPSKSSKDRLVVMFKTQCLCASHDLHWQ